MGARWPGNLAPLLDPSNPGALHSTRYGGIRGPVNRGGTWARNSIVQQRDSWLSPTITLQHAVIPLQQVETSGRKLQLLKGTAKRGSSRFLTVPHIFSTRLSEVEMPSGRPKQRLNATEHMRRARWAQFPAFECRCPTVEGSSSHR